VTFALESGLRKGEQFGLYRERKIDVDRRLISALSYKGRRATRRFVPITEFLLPQLVSHLENTAGDHLFEIDDPKKAFTNACKAAGIDGVSWHSLRHTPITRMVHIYRISPHDVMKISGHTNWKTFWDVYVNVDEKMVRSIDAKIDAVRTQIPSTEIRIMPHIQSIEKIRTP